MIKKTVRLITAKRKASGFKNEKRFSTQKTKCDLKKHFKAQKKAFDFSSDAFLCHTFKSNLTFSSPSSSLSVLSMLFS